MDGITAMDGVTIIAATNQSIERLDTAFLRAGRCEKKIAFDLPTDAMREELFRRKIHQKHIHHTDVFEKINYHENFASMSEGMTGADIQKIIDDACTANFIRSVEREKTTKVTYQDIEDKISYYKRTDFLPYKSWK